MDNSLRLFAWSYSEWEPAGSPLVHSPKPRRSDQSVDRHMRSVAVRLRDDYGCTMKSDVCKL